MTGRENTVHDDDEVLVEGDGAVVVNEEGAYDDSLLGGDFEADLVKETEEAEVEEDPYEVLQAQFKRVEDENKQQAAALAEERRRVSELQNSYGDAQVRELQSHKMLIEHAYAATTAELEEAKRSYRDARNIGDIEAELAASEVLSDTRDKLRQLGMGHQEITKRLENPQVVHRQPTAPVGDPIEQIISTFENPKDQAWLRAHRDDVFGNEARKELAIAIDKTARLKGIQPGSDAYYDYLDREMGYKSEQQQTPAKGKPSAPQSPRKAPLPGAPVSRNGRESAGVERAPAGVKQIASDLGMSVSEYMAYDRAIREGKTHHRYT